MKAPGETTAPFDASAVSCFHRRSSSPSQEVNERLLGFRRYRRTDGSVNSVSVILRSLPLIFSGSGNVGLSTRTVGFWLPLLRLTSNQSTACQCKRVPDNP